MRQIPFVRRNFGGRAPIENAENQLRLPFRAAFWDFRIGGAYLGGGAGGVRESGLDGGFGLGGFGIIAMGLGLGEYGCILCLPAGMILTPSSFIITIGLWTNPPGRRIGLRFVFIIAPVTIIRCAATAFPPHMTRRYQQHAVLPYGLPFFFEFEGKGIRRAPFAAPDNRRSVFYRAFQREAFGFRRKRRVRNPARIFPRFRFLEVRIACLL